ELQGVMGRYYALHDKEDASVADAARDHYRPVGPSDAVPTDKVAIAVALADKLDALTGFFAAGEKPTGSGDPFALRRAALGIIRIILENELRLPLTTLIPMARQAGGASALEANKLDSVVIELAAFFQDRFRVVLKDRGAAFDLVAAVFALDAGDLRLANIRLGELQTFLKSDDGANLLAGYKRAINILKIEEKKDGKVFISEVSEKLLSEPAEKALFAALAKARTAITAALEKEDFAAAMQQMAGLRVPVDGFFEGVKVNAEDKQVRENRLNLLASLRATLHQVADFSRIEG
ncbi:MAG: glycine--tRNA ligase subunit beta, partial [Alphaproteobacteria bacterium]|nr:glycine--tRNA ligase subunit beta [Alphaproteobacteria bacterium]